MSLQASTVSGFSCAETTLCIIILVTPITRVHKQEPGRALSSAVSNRDRQVALCVLINVAVHSIWLCNSNDSTSCSTAFPLRLFNEAVDSCFHLQELYLLFISVQDSGNFFFFLEWPPTSHHLFPPVQRWRCCMRNWYPALSSSTCKKGSKRWGKGEDE